MTASRRLWVLPVTGAALVLGIAAALAEPGTKPQVTSFDTGSSITGVKVAAAGDIACDPGSSLFNNGQGSGLNCRQLATSDLLVRAGYAAVLVLGDIQYEDGALSKFNASYEVPLWYSWFPGTGLVIDLTLPHDGSATTSTSGRRRAIRPGATTATTSAAGTSSR